MVLNSPNPNPMHMSFSEEIGPFLFLKFGRPDDILRIMIIARFQTYVILGNDFVMRKKVYFNLRNNVSVSY